MVLLPEVPQPDLIRAELKRVLASDGFLRSERLTRLLQLLVDKAIAGEIHEFDTSTDPEARLDAHRLRQRLQEYYEGLGAPNPHRLSLPKGGNSLVMEPRTIPTDPVPAAAPPPPSPDDARPARRLWIAGAVVAVLAVAGAWWFSQPAPSSTVQSLAILPFANLTGDAAHDALCDGLTDELIDRASRIPGLRVVARGTAFQFREKSPDIRALARRLEVDAVMEGVVRREAKGSRITVQLTRASDGSRLFSETYSIPDQHPILVQERLGQLVEVRVATLLPGVVVPEQPAPVQDIEVRSLVTRAAHLAERRTPESLQNAIADAEEAIRRQPQHPLAYAVLSDALLSYVDFRPPAEWRALLDRAERAAHDSIARSPGLAGPHATLAAIKMNYSWDFRDSEEQFRKAIAINPNHSSARTRYSRLLTILGRSEEALEQARMARLIDPLSVNAVANVGHVLYFSRQYEQSLVPLQRALDLDARYRNGHMTMARALALMGRYEEARAHLTAARQISEDAEFTACAAYVEAKAGNSAGARNLLAALEAHPDTPASSIATASAWAALGEKEKAVRIVDEAIHARDPNIIYLGVSPAMDPLRNIPRFAELSRAVRVQ